MGRKRLVKTDRVLSAIQEWMVRHGVPPTINELRQVLGVSSTRTVHRYLTELEELGLIARWKGARGIRLLRAATGGPDTISVPILGVAPAGAAIWTEENLDGWLHLPKDLLRPTNAKFFLLEVRGDSMNQAHVEGGTIESGDLVLVRQDPSPGDRSVVVALVDGEVTIKRLVLGPDYCILKPDSSRTEYHPVLADGELTIQGEVVKVIKGASRALDA